MEIKPECMCFCTRRIGESQLPGILVPHGTLEGDHKVWTGSRTCWLGNSWLSLEPAGVESGKQREERVTLEFRIRQKRKSIYEGWPPALSPAPDPRPCRHMVKFYWEVTSHSRGKYDSGSCAGAGVGELRKVFKRPKKGKISWVRSQQEEPELEELGL